MSRHMLLGLEVKHPSGLRLHHFFNRWDALYIPPGNLSVFKLKRALKDPKDRTILLFCCSILPAMLYRLHISDGGSRKWLN